MGERRVVVTGMGMLTPLGCGRGPQLAGDAARRIRRAADLGASTSTTFDVKIAGEIVTRCPRCPRTRPSEELGIHSRFALVAGREAWASVGPRGRGLTTSWRTGDLHGRGQGHHSTSAAWLTVAAQGGAWRAPTASFDYATCPHANGRGDGRPATAAAQEPLLPGRRATSPPRSCLRAVRTTCASRRAPPATTRSARPTA